MTLLVLDKIATLNLLKQGYSFPVSHQLIKCVSILLSLFLSLVKHLDELVHNDSLLLTNVFRLGLTAISTFWSYLKVCLCYFELWLVLV